MLSKMFYIIPPNYPFMMAQNIPPIVPVFGEPGFKIVAVPLSRDEIETKLGLLAAAAAERDRLVGRLNRAKLRLAQTLEARIQIENKKISEIELELERWAEANKEKEFGESKSLRLLHGVLKFRTGPQKVQAFKGWAEAVCLATLKKLRWKKKADYIRIAEDLDKQTILNDFKAGRLTAEQLAKFGLEVVRGEFFAIELDKTPKPARA